MSAAERAPLVGDDDEWESVAAYREHLQQLGRDRSAERKEIPVGVKWRARSVRICVVLLVTAISLFACVLVTLILRPSYYHRLQRVSVTVRSPACGPDALPNVTGDLSWLQLQLASSIGRTLPDELRQCGEYDVMRFIFEDGPADVLYTSNLGSHAPADLIRLLSLGVLWPRAVEMRLAAADACTRARAWPHTLEVAAYAAVEWRHGSVHGRFRHRQHSRTLSTVHKCGIAEEQAPPFLGSPWGPTGYRMACSAEGEYEDAALAPSVAAVVLVNALLALAVVAYARAYTVSPFRQWLVRYANRVAPEFTYNYHHAQAIDVSAAGDSKPPPHEAVDEQLDGHAHIDAKLRGYFADEFTPLQV